MLDNIKIGNQITLLRREKHLTGEKLAELLDVSPQAVLEQENFNKAKIVIKSLKIIN